MIAEESALCSTFEVSTRYYIWRRVIRTLTIVATFGTIGEYKEGEEQTQYVERMEQYLLANDIKEEKKKRAILPSSCGSKTCTLIRDLLQLRKPTDTGLEDNLKEVGKHYSPKQSEIVERFKFHNRRQVEGESVPEFIADCESSLNIVTWERHWMI